MGSAKDVMELFAERDLRQIFSAYEGWTISPLDGNRSSGRLFQATRGTGGREETALIAVSFDPAVQEESVTALDHLPDRPWKRIKKYLLTPQAADTTSLPPHVKVLLMQAFAFTGGELVWLTKKKNARNFTGTPVAAQ